MSDLISQELEAAKVEEILASINLIDNALPYLIQLTAEQRQTLPNLDDGRIPFVDKAISYGEKHPEFIPPFVDLKELRRDVDLNKKLNKIEKELGILFEKVQDTRMAAGIDAYSSALSVYSSAKFAAKMQVSGAETIVNDLKKLFEGQGKAKVEENVAQNN